LVRLPSSAGAFLANLDLFIVNIAFPSIAENFGGTSLSSLSWVLTAYAIVFGALLVPAGRMADRTAASTHPLATTPARLANEASVQIGWARR
jgi:MFS family permease